MRHVILLTSVLVAAGCGTRPSEPAPKPSPVKADDPVASLRALAKQARDRLQGDGMSMGEPDVDVRKTDSLTAPYEGTIVVTISYPAKGGDEAHETTYRFAYKHDRSWSLKDAQYKSRYAWGETVWHTVEQPGPVTLAFTPR